MLNIETEKEVIQLSIKNYSLKEFHKRRINNGIFYTVSIFLFYSKKTQIYIKEPSENIDNFKNILEIPTIWMKKENLCYKYNNLKQIGCYSNGNNCFNVLHKRLHTLLDDKDFQNNFFVPTKENSDIGYYYLSINESVLNNYKNFLNIKY